MTRSITTLNAQLQVVVAALHERDRYTAEHDDRTAALACELGKACGLSTKELHLLQTAAAVHDIGKIGIPDQVLCKPGKLDADEWQMMKTHAERGAALLEKVPSHLGSSLASLVRHHHEHYDGSGYPEGLAADDIPALSRIITLADSYDAMATPRSYHQPRGHRAILDVMHGENAHKYDPWMLQQFSQMLAHSTLRAGAG